MDILMPPIAFISLFFFLPSFYLYKFIQYLLSSLFPENMANKVVLITGASSGLGEHIAYEYAKRGAVLVLVARRVKSLQEVAMRCRDIGSPSVLVVPADVSKPEECQRFIEKAINNFGRLDHLVNNAGIESVGLVEEITDMTNYKVLMDVNFWGSVYPTYFAIPHLKASKGRVVVMSSMAGYTFVPRMAFYSASKGALISFYDTLRMEFGSEIAISIIAPGVIESEMTKGKVFTTKGKMEVDQELRDAMLGLVPVQPAKDFAKAVVSRVCTGARYIIEPKWWYGLYFHRVFLPEIVDYWQRVLYSLSPQVPVTRSLSKRMLYFPIKRLLYAQSIQSAEIKKE
ncbi:hypothetical protein LUZ61_000968 [Rhynchospora tenuis]|uniref:Ketoreductase domain-containing protein n=1 Tax=Rhynchospora tenuis TaxID=198213 RepID=A0AAD5ZG56_9POAL|nr:hypothetical protein LUZ61_000968 [Rhynchospora tenuis]